jgi:hypothetical protein
MESKKRPRTETPPRKPAKHPRETPHPEAADADWMDRPRSFANRANLAAARALDVARVRPLRAYVAALRETAKDATLPDFDPLGGGVDSTVLFLMEAPSGNASVARGGSGFICPNNDDVTAVIDAELKEAAGLARDQVVVWNACPFYVGSATKIRKPTLKDMKPYATHLVSLLKLLPKLKVLVTLGAVPREFWAKQCFGDDDLRSRIVEVRPRRPAGSRGAERVRRRRRGPSR